ncbi:MAG: hypothetical protein ABIN91_24855 [Mucilaginibacter sp.]|uniref:hypothetical protein n=1 Tax=Mucilaginibacter sp. TaxID=1882438 RepID=UPI0032640F38
MIKVNIDATKGFNTDELKRIEEAQQLLIKVVNHDKFKERVLRFTTDGLYRFHYRKSFLGNWIDKPYSNRQVYEIITRSSVSDDTAEQIDMKVAVLPGKDIDALGYTSPGGDLIYTYRNWVNNLSMAQYVGHLAHEWCHQLGFDHESKRTERNEHSVPFGIGKIIENIAWEC